MAGWIPPIQPHKMFDRLSDVIIQYRRYHILIAVLVFLYFLNWVESMPRSFHVSPTFRFGSGIDDTPDENTDTSQHHESNDRFGWMPWGKPKETLLVGLPKLCKETNWTQGLWLHCHSYCGENKQSSCGGTSNARNRYQTCLRLAIDAGASLILSSVTMRSEEDIQASGVGQSFCPENFLDVAYLQEELGQKCPQLRIRTCDDRSGIETVVETAPRTFQDQPNSNGTFRKMIHAALAESEVDLASISDEDPVVVSYGDAYIGWDYKAAGELATIRKALFKVIQYNETLQSLGLQVLKSPQLKGGDFIGVHLRAEKDWPAAFGSPADQMRLYTEEILRIRDSVSDSIRTVYVSCGDLAAIQTFREMLEPLGFIVHDKWTLSTKNETMRAQFDNLGFDGNGIVEYQIHLGAKFWMGLLSSSMSMVIAYSREVESSHDFLEDFIFSGSSVEGAITVFPNSPAIKGNNVTKLMVVNGWDISSRYP